MSQYQQEVMTDRIRWTKAQLQRMIALKQSGTPNQQIFQTMQREFGVPHHIGELNAELYFLNKGNHLLTSFPSHDLVPVSLLTCIVIGPSSHLWNPAMEQRVKELYGQYMKSKDITTELFHQFAKPDMWQETYRKIQQMKLQGRMG